MILLTSRIPGMSPHRRKLLALASRILEDSGRADAEISILITDDVHMRELNATYRGKDRATDVLSFSQVEGRCPGGPAAVAVLGDVAVSADRARAQAEESGEGLGEALSRLVAHGVLHLLGYDHEGSAARARAMREMESRYQSPPLPKARPRGRKSM